MFRPQTIFKCKFVIPRNKMALMYTKLYDSKVCQIKKCEDAKSLHLDDSNLSNYTTRVSYLINLLERYKIDFKKNNILEYFKKGKKEKSKSKLESKILYKEVESQLEEIEESIISLVKELSNIESTVKAKEILIDNLNYLPNVKIDEILDTSTTKKFLGVMDSSVISEFKSINGVLLHRKISEKEVFVIAISTRANADKMEDKLHKLGIDLMDFSHADKFRGKRIKEVKKLLQHEDLDMINLENEIHKKIHGYYIAHHSILKFHFKMLKIQEEKLEAQKLGKITGSLMIIEAWVPKKHIKLFEKIIVDITPFYLEYLESKDAPTLLKNPKIIQPFESLTELYSLPKYAKFDPTPILAITFSLFFSFMLTDSVYGLILLLFGVLLLRGKGSYDEGVKNIGIILTIFGVFTLTIGAIFGSYFGDFFQRIGFEVPLIINSLKQVMIVLIIALGLGILHLTIGLIIGIVENFKEKNILDAVKDQGVWLLFVFSIILFILKQNQVGLITLFLSVALLVTLSIKKDGLISGILSIFNFPGFLGDLFSYARLTALALGTTGIALAINFMAILAWEINFIGPIIAILIFIIGHLFNLAINGLGAFVHSIRLHFLEFFSKFYHGGGTKYSVFGGKKW